MAKVLCDATIFTGEAFVEGHALLIADGKVTDIVRKIPADAEKISCRDKILAPGFIDAQVNGGGGIRFNSTPTKDACLAIARAHRRFGTAFILPTVTSDRPEIIEKAIAAMREARREDRDILGIHIEGPHLAPKARGAHKAEYLRAMAETDERLYRREGDEVMLVTVAPETVPPEQIKKLCAQGAIVSLGHTSATPEQIRPALAAGATGFTHLFNGMDFDRGRNGISGPVRAALDGRESWCGLIADGHHVSAEHIRLALQTKPQGKVFLVSDAMAPAAGGSAQNAEFNGEAIRVEDGCCINSEGKLAGSAITLADAVKNCIDKFGIDPAEALRMASMYPAAFLGLDGQLGKLLPGYAADVVVMDAGFKVKGVVG